MVLLGLGLGVVLPTLRRLLRSPSVDDITPQWLASFTPEAYLPMGTLLNEEDFDFLSRQPGFDLALHRKLRRERLEIFRMYLHRMIVDFSRLHFAARVLMASSHEDHSALVFRLIWLNFRFVGTVTRAEIACYACRFGIGSLSARALVARLNEMHQYMGAVSSLPA